MRRLFSLLIAVALVPAGAEAADWTATRLRGPVFADARAGDGHWSRLRRGDVIDDARTIRTLGNARVEFQSGDERISFGPGTEARIIDRAGRRFTTVSEQAGTVTVSAEARGVVHFSVETPYLVAVVKGTVFSVNTGARGSGVTVARGLVAVTDRQSRRQVLLPEGRSIVVMADGRSVVSGETLPALVHPTINGVVEDADPAVGTALPRQPPLAGDLEAGVGSTIRDVTQVTGVTGKSIGTAVGNVGSTVVGLGQAMGAVGSTLGSTVGGLGSGTQIGAVTSSAGSALGATTVTLGAAGSALGATTVTLGAAVSGVGAAVTSVGATAGATGGRAGGALSSAGGAVTSTLGGALTHLGL